MVAMGCPTGRRSHVASHSRSEAGRCRCEWIISAQLTCPTLGMTSMFGSLGACGRRILRSVGRGERVHRVRCQIFNLSACRETATERFNRESDAALLCDRLDYVIMGCASLHDVIIDMDPERRVR
jgi:hypothetical protein